MDQPSLPSEKTSLSSTSTQITEETEHAFKYFEEILDRYLDDHTEQRNCLFHNKITQAWITRKRCIIGGFKRSDFIEAKQKEEEAIELSTLIKKLFVDLSKYITTCTEAGHFSSEEIQHMVIVHGNYFERIRFLISKVNQLREVSMQKLLRERC